jgi:pilus assembly protein CpaE
VVAHEPEGLRYSVLLERLKAECTRIRELQETLSAATITPESSSRNAGVQALQNRWDRLSAGVDLVLKQRGADVADLSGGASGLLVRDYKGISGKLYELTNGNIAYRLSAMPTLLPEPESPRKLQALEIVMKINEQVRVLLVEDNVVNARFAEGLLANVDDQAFQVQCADTLLGALELLVRNVFDVALVDLSLPDSNGLETFLTIQRHAPQLPIIIVTSLDDEAVALSAVRRGAQDFLAKGSLKRETLVRALNYAIARSRNPPEPAARVQDKATVVSLLGSNGGVGTTTLACHWALELNRQTSQKVLLIDLEASSTGASFLMKQTAPHTLLDAVQNLHRLDAALWSGFTCSPRKGVDLLQAPGVAGIHDPPTAERVRHILRFARSLYDWIVLDLGRLTASSLATLEETKELFIVTTPALPALFETKRLLQRLLDAGFPREKMRLLLNRREKGTSIAPKEIERALSYPFYGSIADDSRDMDEAFAEGRFLDENLQVRKAIAEVIRKWRGIEEKPTTRPGLGFLRFARG